MKKTLAVAACAATLAGAGIFAGTVIGDDGSAEVVDRIQSTGLDPATADVEVARNLSADAVAAGGGKKVTILKGEGDPRTVTGVTGASDGVTFVCPKKYSAIAAGFETDQPGLALAAMSPAIKNGGKVDKRGWFIGVTNLTDTELGWSPWITCAKGVEDKS